MNNSAHSIQRKAAKRNKRAVKLFGRPFDKLSIDEMNVILDEEVATGAES